MRLFLIFVLMVFFLPSSLNAEGKASMKCPEGQVYTCWDGLKGGGCECFEKKCKTTEDCYGVECPFDKYPVCRQDLCRCENSNNNCTLFKEYIEKKIDNFTSTSCEQDSECYTIDLPHPWCHIIISYEYGDKNLFIENIKSFRKNCQSFDDTQCPILPGQNQIGCREGHCVDLRSVNKEISDKE